MTKLPTLSGAQVVRALERAGFEIVRVSGSHHRLVHSADKSKATTVPVHGSKALKKGTLRSIINLCGLTVEDFVRLL